MSKPGATGLYTFLVAIILTSCDTGMQPFANVEIDVKTRPFAIELYPCDASPGDTIYITTYLYSPQSDVSLSLSAELDYIITNTGGNSSHCQQLNMEELCLTSGLRRYFGNGLYRFRHSIILPNDILHRSTIAAQQLDITALTQLDLAKFHYYTGYDITNAALFDSALASDSGDLIFTYLSRSAYLAIDNYSTLIRLTATINCEVDLEMTRTFPVRYSHKLRTNSYNTNPSPTHLLIASTTKSFADVHPLSPIPPGTPYYLNSSPVGTVLVDIEKNFFLGYQIMHQDLDMYQFYSINDSSIQEAEETILPTWCYSDLDATDELQDSLTRTNLTQIFPPRNTDMHHFRVYLMRRDYRPELGGRSGTGTRFTWADGYFKYTQAYIEKYR